MSKIKDSFETQIGIGAYKIFAATAMQHLDEKSGICTANRSKVSIESQTATAPIFDEAFIKSDIIDTLRFSTGERMEVYAKKHKNLIHVMGQDGQYAPENDEDDSLYEVGVFHFNRIQDVLNYTEALMFHPLDPRKWIEIAQNQRPIEEYSLRAIEKAEEIRKGAWANNQLRRDLSNKWFAFNLGDKHRKVLRESHELMLGTYQALEAVHNKNHFIASRDMVALKYTGNDGLLNFYVEPANLEKHRINDELDAKGVNTAKRRLLGISEMYKDIYPEGTFFAKDYPLERSLQFKEGMAIFDPQLAF